MELGEKLLRARQEAGLSQRQLCGEEITRNMLPQIEHGTARPPMDTLRYLAGRLGKPVSYFLDENTVLSPNRQRMQDIRRAYDDRAYAAAWEMLKCYEAPDGIYDREYRLLLGLVLLALAENAIREERIPYARELLEKARENEQALDYCQQELRRARLLLQGRLSAEDLAMACKALPDLDEELLLRAEDAWNRLDPDRAAEWLAAVQEREVPRWNLLMGRIMLHRKQFADAAVCLQKAETAFPRECCPLLESCFRELGDFQQAYRYACKQR